MHIILVFNPIVDNYIQNLIKTINDKNIIIIEFYSRDIFSEKNINFFKQNNIDFIRFIYKNKIEYLKHLRTYKKIINNLLKKEEEKYVYFSHPLHIISNYVFFYKRKNRSNIKYNLIPDGIANYYNINTLKLINKCLYKKLFSFCAGLKYKIYIGHLIYFDVEYYDKIYFLTEAKKIPMLKESKNIYPLNLDRNRSTNNLNSKNILILGQPYEKIENYKNFLKKILIYISEEKLHDLKIFYKPHPSETLKKEILNFFKEKNITTDQSTDLTNLPHKYNIFISSISSSLFILKLMDNNLDVISFIDYDYLKTLKINTNQIEQVKILFNQVGVKIVET